MKINKFSRKTAKASFLLIFCAASVVYAAAQKRLPGSIPAQSRSIIIITEPSALIWLDDILRGKTDQTGKITLRNVPIGARRLRARANGFKETSQNLPAAQRGEIKIALASTTDEAELTFQQAESQTDKQKAAELYRKAISLRPKYSEAYIGLARALSAVDEIEAALKAVADARKIKLNYAEASAVEGRIYSADGNEVKAVTAYRRAIREGKGFQPEAHTGLGLIYRDKAEDAASSGDLATEKVNLNLAANELSIAVRQLAGAPDAEILYQILGGIYEKMQNYKRAITVYQEFLRVFPESNEASAVESFIVQLKKQMAGEQ